MIDAISAAVFDIAAVPAAAALPTPSATAGTAVSVFDIGRFQAAQAGAASQSAMYPSASTASAPVHGVAGPVTATGSPSDGFRAVLSGLQSLNGNAGVLGNEAAGYAAGQRELTPGDMLQLTVRCQEFLFHCELTANVANRTSDGVQQLFRQQS